jgi:hypothetical protein
LKVSKQVLHSLLGMNDDGFEVPYAWPAAAQVASRLSLSRAFVDACAPQRKAHKMIDRSALRKDLQSLLAKLQDDLRTR